MATRGNVFLEIKNKGYVGAYKHWDCYPTALGVKLTKMSNIGIKTYISLLSKQNSGDVYQYIFNDKKDVYEHLKNSDVSYAYIFSYDICNNLVCEVRHYHIENLEGHKFENICDEIWYSLDDAITDYEN